MSLLPPPDPKPETVQVTVLPPREDDRDGGIHAYKETVAVDSLDVREPQLDAFTDGFELRAERWFAIQRDALGLLDGRGELHQHTITFDWGRPPLTWPRTETAQNVFNFDLDQCAVALEELRTITAVTPPWTAEQIAAGHRGAAPHTREDTASMTLRVSVNGDSDLGISPVALTGVTPSASADDIVAALRGLDADSRTLWAWAQQQREQHDIALSASLGRHVATGQLTVTVTVFPPFGDPGQPSVSTWTGTTLDCAALELPELSGLPVLPAGPRVSTRDIISALKARYTLKSHDAQTTPGTVIWSPAATDFR